MPYALGVDGGNTKTIALVAGLDGTIHGWGRAGCSDIYGAPSPEAALEQIEQAVSAALTMANVEASQLVSSCFSLAGADWSEDFTFLRSALAERITDIRVEIVNDALGALRAGSPDGTGVVVACGTGAAIGARSADGRVWHSSFWQEPQGAVELGRKTLRAVYRAALGLDTATSLTGRVLDYFHASSAEAVLHLMTSRVAPHPSEREIGALARVLLDEAAQGDSVAVRIVEGHGEALGDYALVAARHVGVEGEPFTLVLSGGVLRHESRILANALIAQVRNAVPDVQPVFSRYEPAVGALLLALEAAQAMTAVQLVRIESTLPAKGLFHT